MTVYASDPDARPDDEFEPGTLRHLAPGVHGRLLDPRRTPISVVEVRPGTGFVVIRVEGFEDCGATWEVPLEDASHFQFEPEGPRAAAAEVAEMEAAVDRFAGTMEVTADPVAGRRTEACIGERLGEVARWLDAHSRFLASGRRLPPPESRRGDPVLAADLESWLRSTGVWDIEDALTTVFVSNPRSGETVKGHRIVLAELGLADYAGAVLRDPATLEGTWSRARRAEHIVSRLGFVRAIYDRLGLDHLTLWRGASIEGRLEARPGRSFVSTSRNETVARSHYQAGSADWTHVLVRQDVPLERLFMTYLETAAMNARYLEAEAVVLARPGDGWP